MAVFLSSCACVLVFVPVFMCVFVCVVCMRDLESV